MSRVYTVRSNARRDCRKLGLDPDLVKAVTGGFVIDYPDTKIEKLIRPAKVKPEKRSKTAKAPKPARQPRAKREGDPKKDRLISMLADWTSLEYLMAHLGWQAHTVRGALSTAAKARGITIKRQRVDGVTSYRIEPEAEAKAA